MLPERVKEEREATRAEGGPVELHESVSEKEEQPVVLPIVSARNGTQTVVSRIRMYSERLCSLNGIEEGSSTVPSAFFICVLLGSAVL